MGNMQMILREVSKTVGKVRYRSVNKVREIGKQFLSGKRSCYWSPEAYLQ